MIMLLLFLLISTALFAPGPGGSICLLAQEPIRPYEKIWAAVKWVETRDRDTINYQEGAYGRGQIRQCKLDEYNGATGKHYKLRDMLKEKNSKEVFMWHMMQYNDIELAVKRWNGSGPMTAVYWKKVRRYL
jgi:hypothetical protein